MLCRCSEVHDLSFMLNLAEHEFACVSFPAVVVLLFSLPKLYEMRKDDVDRVALLTKESAGKHYELARGKVRGWWGSWEIAQCW